MDNVVIMLIFVAIMFIGLHFFKKQKEKLRLLKEEYDNALRGNDKKRALDAGRAYYSSLRGQGKLTIYDEQAITNDLAAMDDANKRTQQAK